MCVVELRKAGEVRASLSKRQAGRLREGALAGALERHRAVRLKIWHDSPENNNSNTDNCRSRHLEPSLLLRGRSSEASTLLLLPTDLLLAMAGANLVGAARKEGEEEAMTEGWAGCTQAWGCSCTPHGAASPSPPPCCCRARFSSEVIRFTSCCCCARIR